MNSISSHQLKFKEISMQCFDFFLALFFIFIVSLFVTDYSFILSPWHKKYNFPLEDISNLSVQSILLTLLFFLRWAIDKNSFGNIPFIKFIKNLKKLSDKSILISIFVLFVAIFLSIGIARHMALSSSGYDLAVTDQAIWNTTKGDILFSSLDGNINHLGAHFEPILLLITPLYSIWPNVIVLIFLQSFSLGLAIFPLYLIVKHRLNNRIVIFAFIFSYFLSRPVRGIGLLDFHTDSFIVPLIFFSYYFLITKRTVLTLFTLFLMSLCKEDAHFIIVGFALFTCFFQKRYSLGLFLLFAGITGWILVTNLLMPHFANTKSYPYLCWLPFGETYSENLNAVLKKPALLNELFFSREKLIFYVKLFGPLGFLSFLSPKHYILFLIPLLEYIVGDVAHPGVLTISSHYPAHTLPFIFISAIYGLGWLYGSFSKKKDFQENKLKKMVIVSSIYIMAASLLFHGKTDGHKFAKFLRGAKEIRAQDIISYLRVIPDEASVCATNNLVPHLSHRKYIAMWKGVQNCNYLTEYIVIHKDSLDTRERIPEILEVLNQKGYKEVFSDKNKSFYIFFNPDFDIALLDKEPRRLIPMKREVIKNAP